MLRSLRRAAVEFFGAVLAGWEIADPLDLQDAIRGYISALWIVFWAVAVLYIVLAGIVYDAKDRPRRKQFDDARAQARAKGPKKRKK